MLVGAPFLSCSPYLEPGKFDRKFLYFCFKTKSCFVYVSPLSNRNTFENKIRLKTLIDVSSSFAICLLDFLSRTEHPCENPVPDYTSACI